MAKTGRPRKEEGDRGTTQVRCFDEMALLLERLRKVLPLSTAQLLHRTAWANLSELFETHREQIERVEAAERAAEEARKAAIEASAKLLDKPTTRKPKRGS